MANDKIKVSKVNNLKKGRGKPVDHISAQLLSTLVQEDLDELKGMVEEAGYESFDRYMKDSERLFPKKVTPREIKWRNR